MGKGSRNREDRNGEEPTREPTPEEAAAAAAAAGAIPIEAEVTRQSKATDCVRTENGGLQLSFVVMEGGVPVQHTYLVGEKGKLKILDTATGGLTLPGK